MPAVPPASRIIPLAEENRLGFQRTALAAGAFVHITAQAVHDVGDADGHVEPGEAFELDFTLRNSGRATTGGDVVVTLASASPELTLRTDARPLPSP